MTKSGQPYDSIAGIYDANRATYPSDMITQFGEFCRIPAGGIVLDVGSGTGISTRQLREVFAAEVAVIGIEPGNDMRHTAIANSSNLRNVAYLNYPAEALPFEQSSVDVVFVAQALHWFDRPRFYAETARVLRPGGALGLIENNRNWRDSPFLAAYESLLERFGNVYSRHYRSFDIAAELGPVRGLSHESQLRGAHVVNMSKTSFFEWSFTSTKMQDCLRNVGEEKIRSALSELLERFFADETAVEIGYETRLVLARRA